MIEARRARSGGERGRVTEAPAKNDPVTTAAIARPDADDHISDAGSRAQTFDTAMLTPNTATT